MKTLFLLAHRMSFLPSFSPRDNNKRRDEISSCRHADHYSWQNTTFRWIIRSYLFLSSFSNNVTWFCLSSCFGFIHIHNLTSYEFLSSLTHFSSGENIVIHYLYWKSEFWQQKTQLKGFISWVRVHWTYYQSLPGKAY